MKYFKNINSLDELKERFKELARKNHPDVGGDENIMKQINQEYDTLFPIWKHRYNDSALQPTKETAYSTRNEFYTENGWEGEKHDWNRDIKDVAALIRNYVKEVYPTYKFSIKIQRYSMGQTLYTELKEAPQEIYKTRDELNIEDIKAIYQKLNANGYYNGSHLEGEEWEQALQKAWKNSNFYKVYNEQTQAMLDDIEREVRSYNYEDIDSMTDYYDVDFHYSGVKVSSDFKIVEKRARVKEKENSVKEMTADAGNQKSEKINENERYIIEKSQHTKTKEDIYLVKIVDTLEREEFLQEKQKMKELGGYYSKFTHSFIFKEDPSKNLTDKEKTNRETPLVQNEKSENQVELETEGKKKTIVINAFAGPSAGKTTSAHIIVAELKKRGYATEFVPEVAKEMVWDEKFDLLDGSVEGEKTIYDEKKRRIDRLISKVDFIVTDSPTIQSVCFLDENKVSTEQREKFAKSALEDWKNYNTFNYFVERDLNKYEKEGRIHTLKESVAIDNNIKDFLNENGIYFDLYHHNTEKEIVDKIIRSYEELNSPDTIKENKIETKAEEKTTIVEENYKELMKLAPEIINGKRNQMEFTAGENFYSLSIENIGQNRISMMHWYVVNGDVVRDPDIEFILDKENKTLTPMTYQQRDNYWSVENQDGTLDKMLQDDLNTFTKRWFNNLSAQGYISVEKVIENIRTYENSIGMPENKRITELDENKHIHLKEGDDHAKDYVKYSHKCEEYLRFGYEVDEATSGALSNIERIKICDTPEILLKAGLEQKPMLYTQGHLAEALSPKERRNPHKHGLTIEQVKSLPEQFEAPVIIANNPSREDALLMVLCATDNDKLPLIVSVKPDGKGFYELEEVETNMVLTVFGKNNFQHYFESALLPDNIVYISKEKSQMLERLCERQLFACYSSIDFDIIIQKPECVVNMENQKYVRIIQVPEISFEKWLETSGYDKQKFPSEAEKVEAMMGKFEPQTQHSQGILNGKQNKVDYYHEAYAAYQSEVKDGNISLKEKRMPLDLSKEYDCAFCRMKIKRLEKQGNYKEAENWRKYYNENSPRKSNQLQKSIYNRVQHNGLPVRFENTEERLEQESLEMIEESNFETEIEIE